MQLLADRASITRLALSRRLLALIGGYDGNPNVGDLLQLVGAVRALEPLRSMATPVVLIAAEVYQQHLRIAAAYPEIFDHSIVLCYIGEGEHFDSTGLTPLPHMALAQLSGLYFYGGGYGNGLWGHRKAAMADALVDWARATGQIAEDLPVFVTGTQIEPSLFEGDQRLLDWLSKARFCRLRDPQSAALLAPRLELATAGVDDALAVFLEELPAEPRIWDHAGPLTIGLHLNAESYGGQDPDALPRMLSSTLEAVVKQAGRPVQLRQILAYEGGWVRETEARPLLETLAAGTGAAIGETIDISIGTDLAELDGIDAAITCSYHTTMATCLREIPTLLVVRNAFYSQKLDGLHVWFGKDLLGMLGPESDPQAAAAFLMPATPPKVDIARLTALCRADLAASTDAIGRVMIEALESEVTAMIQQPRSELSRADQRPLGYMLKYQFKRMMSALARPISARAAKRYASSPAKRDPRRFKR